MRHRRESRLEDPGLTLIPTLVDSLADEGPQRGRHASQLCPHLPPVDKWKTVKFEELQAQR